MSDVGLLLRRFRIELQITQSELAARSGVSFPAIQSIESGRGNPSWSTLEALSEQLGVGLRFELEPVNWDALVACGAPLLALENARIQPTPELLVREIRQAVRELTTVRGREIDDRERKTLALKALLFALKTHFPKFYEKRVHSPGTEQLMESGHADSLIKLKRQATAALARYL